MPQHDTPPQMTSKLFRGAGGDVCARPGGVARPTTSIWVGRRGALLKRSDLTTTEGSKLLPHTRVFIVPLKLDPTDRVSQVLREDSGVRHAEVARGVETHLSASRGSRARRFVVSRSKCGISRGRPWQISWPRTLYAAEVGDPPAGCGEPRVSPCVGFIQV